MLKRSVSEKFVYMLYVLMMTWKWGAAHLLLFEGSDDGVVDILYSLLLNGVKITSLWRLYTFVYLLLPDRSDDGTLYFDACVYFAPFFTYSIYW